MSHNQINYVEFFHRNGYRLTKQREAILDAICNANGHATIAEIYLLTKALDNSIDRSTLYRALEAFVKMGLVICAEDLNGERGYEIVRAEPHHHLVCKHCGNEIEIENQLVDEFYQYLQIEYQYQIEMDHLCIYGVCSDCKNG